MNFDTMRAAVADRHKAALGGDEARLKLFSTVGDMVPEVDLENRLVTVVSTSDAVDMESEVVLPGGVDLSYYAPAQGKGIRSVFLNHDTRQLVGATRNMKAEGSSLVSQIYVSKIGLGQDVLTMVAEGVLRAVSIGFKALESGPPNEEERKRYPSAQSIVRRWLMLEQSFTGIPCNPDAVVRLVEAGKIYRSTAEALKVEPLTRRKPRRIICLS